MKIGIFGGTFNPIHKGHAKLAQMAITSLNLDKLLFIPNNIPPHKTLPANSPSSKQRLEMVKLVASQIEKTEVWDIELQSDNVSYTFETVIKIRSIYPESELYLIVGTDSYLSIDRWVRPDVILENCTLAVAQREEDQLLKIIEKKESLNIKTEILGYEPLPMSSTQARENFDDDRLDPSVKKYIIDNKLYCQ